MVGLQMPGLMAARILAHAVVTDHQRPPQRLRHQTSGAAEGEHGTVLVHHRTQQRVVAGQLLRRRRLDRADTSNMADGPAR